MPIFDPYENANRVFSPPQPSIPAPPPPQPNIVPLETKYPKMGLSYFKNNRRKVLLAAIPVIFVILALSLFLSRAKDQPEKTVQKTQSKIASLIANSSPSPADSVPQGSKNIYSNGELGFSITGPEGWQKTENISGSLVVYVSPEKEKGPNGVEFPATINIVVETQPGVSTIDSYSKQGNLQRSLLMQNYKLLGSSKVTLANEPAYIDDYTVTIGSFGMRQRQAYVFHNGKAYIITFSALPEGWDKYLPFFDQVSASFNFTGIVSGARIGF